MNTANDCAEGRWALALESHRSDLTRFVLSLARDRSVAEDVVQETLFRAWRARATLREPSALRGWLFSIARREHARLYRGVKPIFLNLELYEVEAHSGLNCYEDNPEIVDLRRALVSLPPKYRIPLIMQVMGGFTAAQIAAELDLTVTAVLTRLFRARDQLRKCATLSVGEA